MSRTFGTQVHGVPQPVLSGQDADGAAAEGRYVIDRRLEDPVIVADQIRLGRADGDGQPVLPFRLDGVSRGGPNPAGNLRRTPASSRQEAAREAAETAFRNVLRVGSMVLDLPVHGEGTRGRATGGTTSRPRIGRPLSRGFVSPCNNRCDEHEGAAPTVPSGRRAGYTGISSCLRRESQNGTKPVKQIVFQGKRLDMTSVRKWREQILAATLPQ